ncbi:MAG: sigma factor-like helix-turn-helix DNA-binding protein [Clostridia bacterium]
MNLRDFYPFYREDTYIDVPEELALQFEQWKRNEQSFERKRRRYCANYSLDCGNVLEREIIFVADSFEEHYERKLTHQQLYVALSLLPDKQAKRISAYYLMGMSKAAIARAENTTVNGVKESIARGLANLQKIFRKNL